jgi:hypothetical protein
MDHPDTEQCPTALEIEPSFAEAEHAPAFPSLPDPPPPRP